MDGLKQRIIGALVLISLAVIFVPMLFDEPHTDRKTQAIDLPEEPEFPQVNADSTTAQPDQAGSPPNYRIEESPMREPGAIGDMDSSTTPQSDATVADVADPDITKPETAPAEQQPPDAEQPPVSEPVPASVTSEAASASDEGDADNANEPSQGEAEEFSNSLKGAWLVQLGSFGNEGNAQRLRDRLRDAGYTAHTQAITRGEKTLTRVFSGPYAEKTDANAAKQALDEAYSVNSLVMAGDQ